MRLEMLSLLFVRAEFALTRPSSTVSCTRAPSSDALAPFVVSFAFASSKARMLP